MISSSAVVGTRVFGVGVVLAALAFVTPGCAEQREPADVKTLGGGGRIGDLAVCGDESFDADQGVCSKDERGEAIRSSAVACSLEYDDAEGESTAVEMTFGGKPVLVGNLGPIDRDQGSLWVRSGSPYELPPGDWSCQLSVGEKALETRFRTGGTAEAAPLGAVVCLTSRVRAGDCPLGTEAQTFRSPSSLTCSSTIIGDLQGASVPINVDFEEQPVGSFSSDGKKPVTLASATFDTKSLDFSDLPAGNELPPGDKLPSGEYVCRYYASAIGSWEARFDVTD